MKTLELSVDRGPGVCLGGEVAPFSSRRKRRLFSNHFPLAVEMATYKKTLGLNMVNYVVYVMLLVGA